MRHAMLVAMAVLVGCAGANKEKEAAAAAETAKYQQAVQDETAKAAALDTKVKALEKENATLKAQAGELQAKLTETSAAKSELEVTAAKLNEQSQELQGKQIVKLSDKLLFGENSSKLTAEAKRTLDAMADALGQQKDKHIVVAGYTDDMEGGGKNAVTKRWQLSTTRALEAAKYLAGRGLDPTVIAVAGFGQARPVTPNTDIATRGQNRRVEIALTPAESTAGVLQLEPARLK